MLQLLFKTPQVEAQERAQWIKALATQTWTLKFDFWNIHKKQQNQNNNKTKTLPYNPTISLLDRLNRNKNTCPHKNSCMIAEEMTCWLSVFATPGWRDGSMIKSTCCSC